MASASTGTSSGSSSMAFEGDLQALMDQRKRKRMISNRESARRSRMRKQKHMDDLMAQVALLKKDNHQIMTSISIATQHFLAIEAENSVLRAQADELSHRLESLNDIISFMNTSNGGFNAYEDTTAEPLMDNFLMNPLNLSYLNQPIMASADMFQY